MSASSLWVSAACRGGQSLEDLLDMSASQLCHADIAEMNLLCATGLPGAEDLSVGRCLATLDAWARRVRRETDRHLYRFRQAPAEFNHSEGCFRMLMLVTVLQQDFGVRYSPDRIRGIDFRDSRDLFIHGLLEEPHTGTCASMPVLYVAAGRRLGYPLKLVLTHGHVFARWDGAAGRDRFNVECASRGMLSFPDEYYKTWPTPLTDEQVRKGRYLLSLGAAEELAVFAESRGHCLLDNGRTREARMAYEHACRLDPLSPGHWGWLDDARVREAARVPDGGNLNTFSNWGCSMTISCLRIPKGTVSAEPLRTFPLDSTRYRNYHPTLGRWIERDEVGNADGDNLLCYCEGRVIDHVDPSGALGMTFVGGGAQAGLHEAPGSMARRFGTYFGINVVEQNPGEMGAGLLSHRHYKYEVWECDPGNLDSRNNLKSGEKDSWFWDARPAGKIARSYHSIMNLTTDGVLGNVQYDPETIEDLPPEQRPDLTQYSKCTSGWIRVEWEAMAMSMPPEEFGGLFQRIPSQDPAFWDEYAHKPSQDTRPSLAYGPTELSIQIVLEWQCDVVTKFEVQLSSNIAGGPQRPGHGPYTDVYVPGPPDSRGVRPMIKRVS